MFIDLIIVLVNLMPDAARLVEDTYAAIGQFAVEHDLRFWEDGSISRP